MQNNTESVTTASVGKHKYRKWKILLVIVVFIAGIRIALPYVVLHYANKTLAGMDGYFGHVNDVDLSIFRGAYTIKSFYIDKNDSALGRVPFISSEAIDISIEWKSLFDGRIVGELEFLNPILLFTKDKAEPAEIQKDTNDFRKILKTFMPLKINRFQIINGIIQYIDFSAKPIVNIRLDDAQILAQNLSSVQDTALLPATVVATANLYKGKLDFKLKLDPLADKPAFDMNVELENTSLPELNEFFKAYAKIDINKGTFGLYAEMAGKDGAFIGYVKPLITNLDVVGSQDRNDSFFNKLWEVIVGAAGVVLKNQKKDQVATKIPIEGKFGKTTISTWYAITDLLRNAFIQALYPSIDYQINLASATVAKKEGKNNFFRKKDNNLNEKNSAKKEKKSRK